MRYFIFILSLIQPVIALPFSIIEAVGRHKSFLPLISVALAFSIIAFSIDPPFEYDLYRHYLRIEGLKGLGFKEVLDLSRNGYYLFDSYAWLINKTGLPKQFFTASIVLASYMLVFLVFNDIKIKHFQEVSQQSLFLVFIAFWLSINFVGLSSGIRNGFANIIVFYISYSLIYRNSWLLFLSGSFFAFYIHPFSALVSTSVIISFLLFKYSRLGKFFLLLGLVFLIVPALSKNLIGLIDSVLYVLSFDFGTYLKSDSDFGAGYIDTVNTYGFIASFIIARLPVYIGIGYLLVIKARSNSALYLLLCGMVLYMLFFYNYHTMYFRMSSAFLLFNTVFLLNDYFNTRSFIRRVFVVLYICSLILYSVLNLYLVSKHEEYITSLLKSFKGVFLIFMYVN